MTIDEQHVALPRLYGAPAYARPPRPVEVSPRPFDPDDLPIEAFQAMADRDVADALPGSYGATGDGPAAVAAGAPAGPRPRLSPRPLSLRALAGRVLDRADPWPHDS